MDMSDNMIYSMQMTMNFGFDNIHFLFEKFTLDSSWGTPLSGFLIILMAVITESLKYVLENRIKVDAELDMKARRTKGESNENSTKTARHLVTTSLYMLLRGINYC